MEKNQQELKDIMISDKEELREILTIDHEEHHEHMAQIM